MNSLWKDYLASHGLMVGDKLLITTEGKDYESIVCEDGVGTIPNHAYKPKLTYAILFESASYIRLLEKPVLNSMQKMIVDGLLTGSKFRFIYKTTKEQVFVCENNDENGKNDGAYTKINFLYNAEVFTWLTPEMGVVSLSEIMAHTNKMNELKAKAHDEFDKLWKGQPDESKTRTSEYIWLSRMLNKSVEDTHFGKLTEMELHTVIKLSTDKYETMRKG